MPAALEVDGLSKRYGDIVALDEVSLSVDTGECLAILGPNGAGKSTLLECISTIRTPQEGTIHVEGNRATSNPMEVRRSLGVAFQQPLASKHLTAHEVLVHHARLYGVAPDEADMRAGELLAFVDLEGRSDDRVGEFSGGMQRRLDLARVLMTRPRVLLLDEPTAGLDPRAREHLHEKVLDLTAEGTSVVVATHDLDEADRLADRVVILDQGHIAASGEPETLVSQAGHRVVDVVVDASAAQTARAVLEGVEGVTLVGEGSRVCARLPQEGASPGRLVDALEAQGVPFEEVRVRQPDLGDVFLMVTGRRLGEKEDEEGSA